MQATAKGLYPTGDFFSPHSLLKDDKDPKRQKLWILIRHKCFSFILNFFTIFVI